MREIRFPMCRHPIIWKIEYTHSAIGRRPPAVPATGPRFGQSKASRSASSGYPSEVTLASLFLPAAEVVLLVPIVLLLIRSVSYS